MADFNLTKMAVNMYCPGNVVQTDDAGLPSILVWIPAFRLCDVLNTTDESIHPAFIVNGRQIPGFYYSKYQNVVNNGKAYSLPAEDPHTYVAFDTAREYCEAKGYGWHMSTAAEWAAIALWCKKNGHLPYGNNDYGKDSRESEYKAITSNSEVSRVATGTGPMTWSHDGTPSGIWDMNGNIWEWQSGLRLVWGELQIFANNDAVDPDNPQNATSTCWKAINAADGSLVDPECTVEGGAVPSGNTVRLDYILDADSTSGVWTFVTSISNTTEVSLHCAFEKVTCSGTIGEAAKVLLRALALLPDTDASSGVYENNRVWWANARDECVLYRGGPWDKVAYAGIFSLSGAYGRNNFSSSIGFRSAYIPNI